MTAARDADRANAGREREVGGARVRTAGIIVVGLALIVLTVVLTYCLVVFWPPSASGTGGQPAPAPESTRLLWWTVDAPSRETSLFLTVLTAGGIGGCIHSLRSLYWYVGNRNLRYSWLLMYFTLPLVGALMALVTYVVLRGGLTTAVVGPEGVNPFGVAAVSALVGLFSREATEKLRIIFETVLTSAEKGKDQALPAEIRTVTPAEGPPGTTVTVTGAGLTDASEVRFGAAVAQPHVASDTHLTVAVPTDATTGPITVVTPAGVAQSPNDFVVLPLPPSPEAASTDAREHQHNSS
ncbi:MAG TPA: IPT/TIG domain-containing protein [Pilimelia sp.]|nr:IPT/TIG domain-containing protein [Pilimelia sp.]